MQKQLMVHCVTYSSIVFFSCILDERNTEVLLSMEDLPFHGFFIQRIRISPDHRYIAAGVKSTKSEESVCIIVKLNTLPVMKHIIPNVFSFGKQLTETTCAL